MAIEYPDVIGEYISASQRFEVSGLQYAGTFEPLELKTGEVGQFHLYLQNMVNGPLQIEIKLHLPQSSRFRGQPVLSVEKTEHDLELGPAEAGRLVIPFTTTDKVVDGRFTLNIEAKSTHEKGATRIRNPRPKPVKVPYLDYLVGLDLVGSLGAHYSTKNGKKASFDISISREVVERDVQPNLEAATYQQAWNLETAELTHKAQSVVNEGRAKIFNDLGVEALFTALYAENTERFADTGVPLRIGEAIAISKLLTYTVHVFLGRNELQNALLCPTWERAIANDLSTENTLSVIKYAGYRHILRLATALSFGLIAETTGKHLWSQQERQEVTSYIADTVDEGSSLQPDFLYLPLMLGALKIVNKVRLPDEDIDHTVALIRKARQARPDILVDEDMAQANSLFDHLLAEIAN